MKKTLKVIPEEGIIGKVRFGTWQEDEVLRACCNSKIFQQKNSLGKNFWYVKWCNYFLNYTALRFDYLKKKHLENVIN